jgi:hypothetical protein
MANKPKVAFPFADANLERMRVTVNESQRGRLNATGTVTLTANAASTTVTDPEFTAEMVPVLMATTANGAAAIATTYVSARTNGTFTLTHANNAQTDRTFLYIRIG